MGRKIGMFGILVAALAMGAVPGAWAAGDTPPIVQKNCMKCHQNFGKMDNIMAGNLSGTSLKANSIQMKINDQLEMVKFTAGTDISNVPDMKALKSGMALRVPYKTKRSLRHFLLPGIQVSAEPDGCQAGSQKRPYQYQGFSRRHTGLARFW